MMEIKTLLVQDHFYSPFELFALLQI